MSGKYRVAIVGGGASGALTALHLKAAGVESFVIIEPGDCGRGIAYGTQNSAHVLNVRASAMSAYHDQPTHFVDWATSRGIAADDFAPRRIYGDYLAELVTSAAHDVLKTRVQCLYTDENGVDIECEDGARVRADYVVLALGHGRKSELAGADVLATHSRYHASPFGSFDARPHEHVLVVGTGLTAVDAVLSLANTGHAGPITMLSRRGILPQTHGPVTSPVEITINPGSLSELVRYLRRILAERAQGGQDWRPVVDGMRPHSDRVWAQLSFGEQKNFLRYFLRSWEVHRHRMPASSAHVLSDLRSAGQLRVRAMRDYAFRPLNERIEVCGAENFYADRVVNCASTAAPAVADRQGLLPYLIKTGVAQVDPLGLGVDVNHFGQLPRTPRITAIGPLRRGRRFWETTAVPDIRKQAAMFAAEVA